MDSHSGILAYLQTEAGFASHASSMPQRQRHLRRAAAAAVIATTALAWAPARLKPVAPTRRSAATLQTPVAQATERPISTEWELDCFSRPVVQDGKKLWELLVVDSTGQWREAVQLPATGVNSVAVREAVEGVIARAPVKPTVIRFFRRQMLNMLTIALGGVAAERPTLRVAPSRATHAIYDWLEERERDVYPNMEGYAGAQQVQRDRMTAPTTPARLPEALRGEQYAFVTLPVAEVQAGGGVTEDNVGVGKMINVKSDLDPGAMLPGVAILTRRADALAMSLASTELASVRADSTQRQLVLDVALDESFLVARLDDSQRVEAAGFEKAKAGLDGLHFVVVQRPDDDGVEPAGFWLLREMATA